MGEGGTRELHRALSRAVENRTKYKTRSRQRRSSSVVFSLILYKKVSKVGIPKVGRKVLEVSLRDFTNTTHPILGLRIFEGSHLPIKTHSCSRSYVDVVSLGSLRLREQNLCPSPNLAAIDLKLSRKKF